MANEVVITTLLGNNGDPVEYTVAAGTAIAKGTIMKISSSPQTAAAATADGNFIAGIAATEKTATDGITKMSCITHCVCDAYSTTGMVLGQPQKIEGANAVTDADDDTIEKSAEVFGYSLETNAGTAASAVLVNLGYI